jgi:hypothetical protein
MKSIDDFSPYEKALWKLPVSRRISFISQRPDDDQEAEQQVLTEEDAAFWGIKSAALMIKFIVESDGDICFVNDRRTPRRGSGFHLLGKVRILEPVASCLNTLIELDPSEVRRLLPGHRFNPYFELLCRVVRKLAHAQPALHRWRDLVGDEAEDFVRYFNRVVKLLRGKGRGQKIQNSLDGWRKRIRARTASSRQYIDQIFALYPDLFSIHLNLSYCMKVSVDAQTWESPFTLQQAKAHLARFDRFMRAHYPVVGHLYWREYGLRSGYHFRVVYFLNSLIKSVDHRVIPLLEEYWRKDVTQGSGRHDSSKPARYRHVGVDGLRAHELRESARKALVSDVERHITQADFWAFHKEGGKCFGRGQAPVALFRAVTGGVRRG